MKYIFIYILDTVFVGIIIDSNSSLEYKCCQYNANQLQHDAKCKAHSDALDLGVSSLMCGFPSLRAFFLSLTEASLLLPLIYPALSCHQLHREEGVADILNHFVGPQKGNRRMFQCLVTSPTLKMAGRLMDGAILKLSNVGEGKMIHQEALLKIRGSRGGGRILF